MQKTNYQQWKEQILTAAKERKIPVSVQFELTGRCNLDCKMCYVHNLDAAECLRRELSTLEWKRIFDEACKNEGVRYRHLDIPERENGEIPCSFNLPSAMHHCCSEPAVTFESNQGLCDRGDIIYDYAEIYKGHAILFAQTMKYVLKKHNK